ncbi:thioredoxin family protein [Maridesulfovibrio sp.]|uniref:thioredoxin family protein n=1 Tax=Maridesulfovibrio sp. TaxID=2795000 RepID=UPI0039F0C507
MSDIKEITEQASTDNFATMSDAIIIFFKEMCPHCKNMEKALSKFGAKNPEVELYSVNSEAKPELMSEFGFERVPTMLFVRDGKVLKVHTGLMNPREMKAMHGSL